MKSLVILSVVKDLAVLWTQRKSGCPGLDSETWDSPIMSLRRSAAEEITRSHMNLPANPSFAVRPAIMSDLDTLATIDALCFPPGIAYPREEIEFLLLNPTIATVVAEHSGVIVGFAAVERRRRSRQNARYGELVTLEVLPQFRRDSIGGILYKALEDLIRGWGADGMHLHVSVENAAAVAFYQRFGFRIVSRIPAYYLRRIDAWQMEKDLS
jgi:ribosomal-protein-alanine N-acetyltransferase